MTTTTYDELADLFRQRTQLQGELDSLRNQADSFQKQLDRVQGLMAPVITKLGKLEARLRSRVEAAAK